MTDSPPFECGPECPAPEHDQAAADVPAYPYMADELWHSMAANEHGVNWDHQAAAEPGQEIEL